jgi:hypothetical protein
MSKAGRFSILEGKEVDLLERSSDAWQPNRKGGFQMKKTLTAVSVVLLVLLLVTGAFAWGPSALLNTTWTGVLTTVARSTDGNVTTTPDNATLTITGEDGDFLVGTLSSPSLDFTCIRDGRALSMTAKGYLISAEIFMGHPTKKGTRPPQIMRIQGSAVGEGNMFQGTLTKTKK